MLSDMARAVGEWADGAGGLGVFVLALLDSSLLALPNATDALIMYLSIKDPVWWWYYAAMGVAGVLLGSWPLYVMACRGGEALLGRQLAKARASGLLGLYQRSAFAGLAGPAFLPAPFPLKIFVLLAGAAAYPVGRTMAALTIGRGARHVLEAGLAAAYRDQAVQAFARWGASLAGAMMILVSALCVALLLWYRRRAVA